MMNPSHPVSGFSAAQLIGKLAQARSQLKALIACLPDDGWLGPRAEYLNPPLWEYGHIVWFQERWCLRENTDGIRAPSLINGVDALYDSSSVPHNSRWELPLLEPEAVDAYASKVFEAVANLLASEFDSRLAYFAELCIYHELMHIEAWWMAFQNLAYAPPHQATMAAGISGRPARLAFAESEVTLGGGKDDGFIFDNEKWRHTVAVPAFNIDANPVSEAAFAEFVNAGGYQRKAFWSDAGWAWREAHQASHPLYWKMENGEWRVRRFDQWTAIIADTPMLHVNHHEATACAKWLDRQLPTAGQWLSATANSAFEWGEAWEWLRDPFTPYPGFSPDPYREYSQPWFHSHFELRGGGPYTHPLLKRAGFRNFYLPHRRDPFAGFRTVSPDSG